MAIERNVVFLYPLSDKLQQLKASVEEDNSYTVYELDSLSEYHQLIGVMEHAVTFSADLKKTELYLNECKKFVRDKKSKNILIQAKNIPPHIFFNR